MNIVRQLREKRGMQQKEFAMRIGVSSLKKFQTFQCQRPVNTVCLQMY